MRCSFIMRRMLKSLRHLMLRRRVVLLCTAAGSTSRLLQVTDPFCSISVIIVLASSPRLRWLNPHYLSPVRRFAEMGYSISFHHPFLDGIFRYKPSILGYHLWNTPNIPIITTIYLPLWIQTLNLRSYFTL